VNIISIEGTNVNLEYIGKVAQITNGFNDIVNPLNLTKNFNFLLENPIVATDVTVKMMLHKGLKLYNEENPINDHSCLRNIGNVNKESNITFEYGKSDLEDNNINQLPFQVQINYNRLDGAKCMRIISRTQQVTTDEKVAEENINITVIGLHSVQQTSKLAEDGDYTKARLKTRVNRNLVKRAMKQKQQVTEDEERQYNNWIDKAEKIDKVIRNAKNKEQDDDMGVESCSDDDDDVKVDYNKEKVQKKNGKTKKEKNGES